MICSNIHKIWEEVLVQAGIWILGLYVCICFDLTSDVVVRERQRYLLSAT